MTEAFGAIGSTSIMDNKQRQNDSEDDNDNDGNGVDDKAEFLSLNKILEQK